MKFARKKDFIIIISILLVLVLVGLFMFFFEKPHKYAQIKYYDEVIMKVDLSREQTITLKEAPGVVLKVTEGQIFFECSDCPDKLCVKTGRIYRSGQMAACLPNGIIVNIISNEESFDAVT